uniref:Uncharacterized protein n=1 Tax=Solanum tuberosum TaxID=4113 RepID=M1CLV1_SOLTU
MMKKKSRKLIVVLHFFRDLFKKIGSVFSKKDQQEKSQIIYSQRIPSSHSPSNWSTVIEEHQVDACLGIDPSTPKKEKRRWRFKVKTPEVCGGGGGGGGGGGRGGGGGNGDNGQGQGQGQGQGRGSA